MQIESILIFIAFVVITSLANKRKEAQHKQRQQQKRQTPTQATQPKPQKTGKRSLQDLFHEMQRELEAEYKKTTETSGTNKKQAAQTIQKKEETAAPFTYESTDPRVGAPTARTLKEKKPLTPSNKKKNSPVYMHEIKDQSEEIGFNLSEEAILNGIIFSEVIGKPKSMRS